MENCIRDLEGLFACVAGAAFRGRAKIGLGTSAALQIDLIDPCLEPSWDENAEQLKNATVFHGAEWARVLRETYGHRPFYAKRRIDGGLPVLLPLMEVRSWLTGTRGVSLPFTDFCDALGPSRDPELFERLCSLGLSRNWKYLEFRGDGLIPENAKPSTHFLAHELDLSPGIAAVEKGIAGAAIGATRKAKSSGLIPKITHSLEGMRAYYKLHAVTRRRHGLPPQPWRFFRNIHRNLVAKGQGFVAAAEHEGKTIAGAVFLHTRKHAVYKFSASDYSFQLMRPANLVMSSAIHHLAEIGCERLHFGRTSEDNDGLRRFKRAWGAEEKRIAYYRYDLRRDQWASAPDRVAGPHNAFFRRMPTTINRAFGALLYPHLD
jgi:hypothetical protein